VREIVLGSLTLPIMGDAYIIHPHHRKRNSVVEGKRGEPCGTTNFVAAVQLKLAQ